MDRSRKPFIGATLRVGSIKIRVTARSVDELSVIIPIQLEAMKNMEQKLHENEKRMSKKPEKISKKISKKDSNICSKNQKNLPVKIKSKEVDNYVSTDQSDEEFEKSEKNLNIGTSSLTKFPPYKATTERIENKDFTFHSISKMPEYKELSFEEIRLKQMMALGNQKEEILQFKGVMDQGFEKFFTLINEKNEIQYYSSSESENEILPQRKVNLKRYSTRY